jgi:hypothetical protein
MKNPTNEPNHNGHAPVKKKPSKEITFNRRTTLWGEYIAAGYSRKEKSFEQFVLDRCPEIAVIMQKKYA